MTRKDGSDVWPDPAGGLGPTAQDGSNVREIYALQVNGWTPFRSLGLDVDPSLPLSPEISPGVTAVGDPALTSQKDESNDMFVRGSDNKLWRRRRVGASWSGWYDMGGSLASSPSAASWGSGSVIVAARLSNGTIGIRQYANGSWSAWSELSAPAVGAASAPALSSRDNDKLDLFVRGADNKLWWRSLTGALPPTAEVSWSAWSDQGGQFVNNPAAVSWGTGRIDVVMVDSTKSILHWVYANGATSWSSRGCCSHSASSPSITSGVSGKLNMLMKADDGQLWHKYLGTFGWSDWHSLGGILGSSPAITATNSVRRDVVALGADGTIKHRSWGQ